MKVQINKKSFFICNWQPDPLIEALRRFLLASGYESKDESNAELIIFVPRGIDGTLSRQDLAVFRIGDSTERPKKVLLIDLLGKATAVREDWLFIISKAPFDWDAIEEWLLKRPTPFNSPTQFYEASVSEKLKLLYDQNKNRKSKERQENIITTLEIDARDSKSRPRLSKSGLHLLLTLDQDSAISQFWIALLLMTDDYSVFEHDLNRELTNLPDLSDKELTLRVKKKYFLDRCMDLRRSLPCIASLLQTNTPSTILLIDDNPIQIGSELSTIKKLLLPKHKIEVWNPREKPSYENELILDMLANYSSLSTETHTVLLKKKILVKPIKYYDDHEHIKNPDQTKYKAENLKKVLDRTHYILVDILYNFETAKDPELGPRIIRGLNRLLKDIPKSISDNYKLESDFAQKEIIAISRADDVDKIHAAFRAGAAGYILKSRLLSLPAEIGRIHHRIGEPSKSMHRNFSQLNRLPPETIRLLRSVHLPSKVSYHQGRDLHININKKRDEDEYGRKEDSILDQIKKIGSLLQNIPKTDLHVHVGSCMSPEFLTVSSLVMLARNLSSSEYGNNLVKTIPKLIKFWSSKLAFSFADSLHLDENDKEPFCDYIIFHNRENGLLNFRDDIVACLKNRIKNKNQITCRSIFHEALKIPDYWKEDLVEKAIDNLAPAVVMHFALNHGQLNGEKLKKLDKDDILRIYLLFLAAKSNYCNAKLTWEARNIEREHNETNLKNDKIMENSLQRLIRYQSYLDWFKVDKEEIAEKMDEELWDDLNTIFYDRENNFCMKRSFDHIPLVKVDLGRDEFILNKDLISPSLNYEVAPINNTLASGTKTKSNNLNEYLQGCEFSGAEHLHHPYLMHLYAQQTIHDFVQQGILYSELRAAVSGYVDLEVGFELEDAIVCFIEAFDSAQKEVWDAYIKQKAGEESESKKWLWRSGTRYDLDKLFQNGKNHPDIGHRFPSKVGLIFTGKRHKPTWQMIREAAAAVLLHSSPPPIRSASEFANSMMQKCRPVGFDLAGPEEEYAPEQFRSEFDRISKLHIPITVHAGENASVQFVESTMLDLGASRIGHGLALVDDQQLMNHAREDGVCIELCPVSNYQTNKFRELGGGGRSYPLKKLLDNGNPVCINTDNPIISDTNIIKEYFQASYAYGGKGLSLWETLRSIRMGFVHSFLSLPERKAILEIVDQIIFDLFTEEQTVDILRTLASRNS